MPVRATFDNPREGEYNAPGGFWSGLTLPALLSDTPDRADLVVGKNRSLSTEEIRDIVPSLAGWLQEKGARPGDAVAWQFPNHPDLVCLFLATWWLGAVAVPFHGGLTSLENSRVLQQIGAASVLLAAADSPLADLQGALVLPRGQHVSELRGRPVSSHDADPAAAAVVLTTSGSSGKPKSVIHSHRSLAHKARQLSSLHGTTADDAVLVPASLAHMAGLIHGVLHPLGAGVKAVIQDRWSPEQAVDAVERERVTMLFGPPIFSLGIASARNFAPNRVESIRLISSGSTAISESYVQRSRETFSASVKRTYGSTEAPIVCNTFPDDPPGRGWTTDGRAVTGVELQIKDPDTGAVLGPHTIGELWLRGPELCDGYLDQRDNEGVFTDGWMRTHDLAEMDEEGFVRISGRISSLVIRGGMNISTGEVEAALTRHPSVEQAVVLGVPDDMYGERVVAFVTARAQIDRDECARWFAKVGVAKYKVPDQVVEVEEIPTLQTLQKPDLSALRAML